MQDWTRFKWNYELRTKFVLLYLYVFTSISSTLSRGIAAPPFININFESKNSV